MAGRHTTLSEALIADCFTAEHLDAFFDEVAELFNEWPNLPITRYMGRSGRLMLAYQPMEACAAMVKIW